MLKVGGSKAPREAVIIVVFITIFSLTRAAIAQTYDQEHVLTQITVAKDVWYRVRGFSNRIQSLHTFGDTGPHVTANQLSLTYCSADSLPEIRILQLAAHGSVKLSKKKTQPPECPNAIDGVVLFYKPAAGYVGSDEFTVQRKGDSRSNGLDRDFKFAVTVQ